MLRSRKRIKTQRIDCPRRHDIAPFTKTGAFLPHARFCPDFKHYENGLHIEEWVRHDGRDSFCPRSNQSHESLARSHRDRKEAQDD